MSRPETSVAPKRNAQPECFKEEGIATFLKISLKTDLGSNFWSKEAEALCPEQSRKSGSQYFPARAIFSDVW